MAIRTYTVHEPADGPLDRLERAEGLVFVRDGFSWSAAILTPFWLLANRLWLALIGYLALAVALQLLLPWLGVGEQAVGWVMVALHILIGFEGDSLRRWTLQRRGYSLVGSVSGRSHDECERRFFEAWLKDRPYILPPPPAAPSSMGTGGRLSTMALRSGRA